jgi:hypothetical protein
MTRGRRGEGPGEFMLVRLLGVLRDGRVLVADQATARLVTYDMDGVLLTTSRLDRDEGVSPRPHAAFTDGSILGQVPVVYRASALRLGEVLPSELRLMRFATDREPQLIADDLEAPSWIWTGREIVPVPFMANAALGIRDDSVHLGAGPAFRVRVYDGARVVRMYGVDRPEQPVTSSDVDGYRGLVTQSYSEERHAEILAALDHPDTPEILPAYTRMLVAEDGTVWVGRFPSELPWDVYGADGALLGGVLVPADFLPMSIRDGRLAGVWTDDLSVEYVRVYDMAR